MLRALVKNISRTIYDFFLAFFYTIWGLMQHLQTKSYKLLLMDFIHRSRHEKPEILKFSLEFEKVTGGSFSFPYQG